MDEGSLVKGAIEGYGNAHIPRNEHHGIGGVDIVKPGSRILVDVALFVGGVLPGDVEADVLFFAFHTR